MQNSESRAISQFLVTLAKLQKYCQGWRELFAACIDCAFSAITERTVHPVVFGLSQLAKCQALYTKLCVKHWERVTKYHSTWVSRFQYRWTKHTGHVASLFLHQNNSAVQCSVVQPLTATTAGLSQCAASVQNLNMPSCLFDRAQATAVLVPHAGGHTESAAQLNYLHHRLRAVQVLCQNAAQSNMKVQGNDHLYHKFAAVQSFQSAAVQSFQGAAQQTRPSCLRTKVQRTDLLHHNISAVQSSRSAAQQTMPSCCACHNSPDDCRFCWPQLRDSRQVLPVFRI